MRRLDIGIVSYGDHARLARAIESIQRHSLTDWRLFIIDNPSDDAELRPMVERMAAADGRIRPVWNHRNGGYAGGVNQLLYHYGETDYVAYCDHDVVIRTHGWDEMLCEVLDQNPECGWVFPGSGHFGFFNGRYHECLWNAGYCWVLRASLKGLFDTKLGHHEEVDFMIRLRLAGYQIGCRPDVDVLHDEKATHADDAAHKPGGRIHDGVVRWMNKWNRYFCGEQLSYSMTEYDARALRYTDWNVDALYLERMTLHYFPDWNKSPRTVSVPGVGEMDVIEVLKPKGCYRGRAI